MKENQFVKANKDRWENFERVLKLGKVASSDDLGDTFIKVTDDLAFAKTFYPNSNTANYLNKLAANYHNIIYENKREKKSRFWNFFKFEVPLAAYEQRHKMLYSLVIFSIGIFIGIISVANDDGYLRLILGDYYVNMTLENIEKGDPMAVYKQMGEGPMSFMIGFNNIRVAFFAFIFGILLSVGTGFILFSNGIVLGAFQYFFIQKKLFWLSFSTIFLHGALEISAIIMAGGAGFIIGNALLFPKTYTRMQALTRGAKQALKIMIGLIPVFVVAALIEGYITRWYLEMPSIVRAGVVFISFAFIIIYFFIYPYYLKQDSNVKYH